MSTYMTGPRYFAMFLQALGAFSAFQLILSWVSATIPRPKAKRAVALALATAVSNASNIATAYLYPAWDAPYVLSRSALVPFTNANNAL